MSWKVTPSDALAARTPAQAAKGQRGATDDFDGRISPFSPETIEGHLDTSEQAWLEVSVNSREYPLACAYISETSNPKSLRFREGGHHACRKGRDDTMPSFHQDKCKGGATDSDDDGPGIPTTLGLGFFRFQWEGHELSALHQRIGRPVTHHHGFTDIFTNLVLFVKREESEVLGQFVGDLIIRSERTTPGKVNMFEYNPEHQHWHHRGVCKARPMDSVVMEAEKKQQLMDDVHDFLDVETRRWYRKHGIPHKRGYLFFGTPGAGKSSIIQALAGSIEYNICYVHPTHPKMSDAKLRHCVNEAPKSSLLIFEDVDALFGKDRTPLVDKSLLTFSGLLNALDGVGKANGQIFLLTTNYRDRLDAALIRNGRVDVHIEFKNAADDQIHGMFQRFYPGDTDDAARHFVQSLRAALNGREVSMAALQHFFILNRKSTAPQAAERVQTVIDEMELRDEEKQQAEKDTEVKRRRGHVKGEDLSASEEE
jgi:chaperone BCS1